MNSAELRGADDGVGHGVGLEDVLLERLGPVVIQFGHLVDPDDRQDDEVPDIRLPGGGDEVVHRGPEEGRRGVVERR